MSLYQALLIVQYVTILGLIVEAWIIFHKWKTIDHAYLFLCVAATIVTNAGYLKEMVSHNEEAYLFGLQLSYMGKVWIPFALFLYSTRLCKIKVPLWIRASLSFIHILTFLLVLSSKWHSLYYVNIRFVEDGLFPHIVNDNGIWYHFYMGLLMFYTLFCVSNLIIAFCREKEAIVKKKILFFAMIWIVESICFLIYYFRLSKVYDTTVFGYALTMGLMYFAIFRFNILDTEKLAKEYLVDEISEGIIAVDVNGEIKYFNRPAKNLLPDIEKEPDKVFEKLKTIVENHETIEKDNHIYVPEKNTLYQNGNVAGELILIPDMTQTITHTNELKKQTELAEAANKAKSAFLANMSHEIRTPINSILGMDEMIIRESKEEDIQNYANNIMTSGKTLLAIVNDILDFTKVEEGKMEINPTQYDTASAINDLVNIVTVRAVDKGLELNVSVNENIPSLLYGDEIRIKQCAMNLLSNAVKYTKKGHIDVTFDYREKDDSSIYLIFKVTDTGIGMKEEDIARLFSPFSRLEQKRNRTVEGTGLGMAITKELLERMDSELNVESVYGEGSTFWFEIAQEVIGSEPVGDYETRYKNESSKKNVYRELFHAPEARILVVDDTETNLAVISNLLKKTQVKIDTAFSGKGAIHCFETHRYDVALIDHMMPEMDGIETLEIMKTMEGADKTVFIALTANAVSGAREMYINAGFSDYISKPVDGLKLERIIMHCIPEEKVTVLENEDATEEATDKNYETDPEIEKIIVKLRKVDGLSVEDGIINCGGEEGFLNVITVFQRTAKLKAKEIEDSYNEEDIENYTIRVHALKSSSRIIGAAEISSLAKDLEKAGKSNDIKFIKDNTDKLINMYREFGEKISFLDENDEVLPLIDDDKLKEAYNTIYEVSDIMDYGMMENILKSLKNYSIPDEDKVIIDKITDSLLKLDWESIKDLAREALKL